MTSPHIEQIEIPMDGGTAEAYVARPASASNGASTGSSGRSSRSLPGVLLHMDAIGLRPRIAEMAQRIADWGYVVLAPNVFWRSGTVEEVGPTGDLREAGAREAFFAGAMPRVGALTSDLAEADIPRYLATLRGLSGVGTGPVGTLGYCMGARLALRTAALDPEVAAVGGFHGGGLVTEEPDSPHLGLARANAAFVLGHADQDGSNPPEAIAELGRTLEAAGLQASNEVYAGAPHGYSMADTSMYDEAAAERHFTELQELFDRTL